jgi:quercetin dioxygenase-like cupin family protein
MVLLSLAMINPTAQSLADAAPITPGRLTSSVLLKAGGGAATLFALAKGERMGEHATPHEALFVVLDGRAEVELGGGCHAVTLGEALRLPAAAPHAVRALSDLRFLLVLLRV